MHSEAMPDTIKFKRKPTKAKLTKRTVEALEAPPEMNGKPAQAWTYDSETPRLAICVWSSGAKTWYWVGRGCDGSRMLRFKLGEFPEMTPDQARKHAGKVSADIANGNDPRTERNRVRTELTLAELFQRYLDEHAKLHKRTWQDDENQFNRYAAPLKSRPLSTITRADVATLHNRIGTANGHYAANRLLALLSKLFSFAATLEIASQNPAKGITRFREQSRDRFLNADELQRFFAALDGEPQLFQDFFKILLLTGARRGNVQAMRFEEIDFDNRTWRIPETKNGNSLTVHLVTEAFEILQRRHAESGDNPWVFPGGRSNPHGHLSEPKGAFARILKKANLADLRIHDLRRTLGSWQAATGTSLPIIGKTLGHKNQNTTQIYARLNLDPVRLSVDTAVAAMLLAAKGKEVNGDTSTNAEGGE